MAGRAKRARFFKENKKRIGYCVLAFIAFVFFAFFTPFGPDYYYGKLQDRKWESNGVVQQGYLAGLYKLGKFYSFTFRQGKAVECYDEMATLFYGFKFSEFGLSPEKALEKRDIAEAEKARGKVMAPFRISSADLPFIGYAIRAMAEHFMAEGRRGYSRNLVIKLYLDEFMEEHPDALPTSFNENMRNLGTNLGG